MSVDPSPYPIVNFLRARFGPGWAIARKTPRNLERYAHCITRKEYEKACADFKEGKPA